jgi:hypothetical protein
MGLRAVAVEGGEPPPAGSVAHDAQTQTAAISTAATIDTTHTPVGTPKGAVVMIVQSGGTTDEVSGVTYGGQAMTRVRKQDRSGSSLELGAVYVYFLGTGLPTGAQTVGITSTGTLPKRAVVSTVTADGDTAVDTSNSGGAATGANPSLALTFSATLSEAEVYYELGSGLAAVISTVEAGGTHQFSHDFGSDVAMWARKHVSGASSTTMGYTAASDDFLHAGVVIKDAA